MKTYSFYRILMLTVMLTVASAAGSGQCRAQKTFGNLPDLHVDGKWLKDENGNKVVLHGVMDTPSAWFNNGRWGWDYDANGLVRCIDYFDKLFTAITDTTQGAYCNVFRLHLEPAWTNDNSYHYCDKTGNGEADIQHFNPNRLRTYMRTLYWKLIRKALNHGLYVVVRPPGVCPETIKVGDVYNNYLMEVWDIVTQNDSIKKYAGQVSIELANEPINLLDANGQGSATAKRDFFQPIVDKIRSNGFTGVVWVPGTGYQSSYQDYANNPVTGYNIGYAVHVYTGWYEQEDKNANGNIFIQNFKKQVPVVETNPIMVTEIDWSPENSNGAIDHYNEFGAPVYKNFGTWATGSTSKWGKAWKAVHDHYGNIGMTLTSTADLINIDKYISNKKVEPAFLDAMRKAGYADAWEACSGACFEWYKDFDTNPEKRPYMGYTKRWTADQGNGKYLNPIMNADFPDPDVIRVGDTFYMVSTTMFHFPGATLMKSKDLVNWEYCANPLKQIAQSDAYNLQQNTNHYATGQWAASLSYSKGKFYIYFIAYSAEGQDDGKNILLSATDPEGEWDMKYMDKHYYDSGWLFDEGENGDGYVYVACGIGDIYVAKLNRSTFQEISSTKVLSIGNGLEGSHMYHIGDYYYIYATYGGTEGSQTIFRSKNPLGPYEEHVKRVFANQHIHQGGLVDTQTGQWWTILFKDAGAIGRVPYLEPVKWLDGWPVIGNSGWDVSRSGSAYAKPNVGKTYLRTYLPTNDTFTDPKLGMQWEWNHNPDNSAWSLMERPGQLRLHTSGVTTNGLKQARNSLTQRIQGYDPANTEASKVQDSYGTIKMDISHMTDGDVAGLSVFQDPYSFIAVKQIGDKRYLHSERHYTENGGTDAEITSDEEITSDSIYLRAIVNFGTNKANYYYSFDNKTYTKFGVSMDMRFVLSVFVGQRFYIFNYATKQTGGYVDIDWFSTEPFYDESYFFGPNVLHTFTEEDLTMETLTLAKTEYTVTPGGNNPIEIICTSKSGITTNVSSNCRYDVKNPAVASVIGGTIRGISEGSTEIDATYTDLMGNSQTLSFTVSVETFPLTEDGFNPSIYGNGSYIERVHAFTGSQYGFGGWTYPGGLDISQYNYIVVHLRRSSSSKPSFRLFDKNDYWASPAIYDMGTNRDLVIDLHNMKDSNGEVVDPSHIYIAGFWSLGGQAIYISEVFLSNDGVNPVANFIGDIYEDQPTGRKGVFDLQGREVKGGDFLINNHQLRGVYIVNGKKVLVR